MQRLTALQTEQTAGVVDARSPGGVDAQSLFDAGEVAAAVEAWREAAERGDGVALLKLAELYDSGTGVIQDFVPAHAFYNLAAARGVAGAREGREALAAEMATDAIAEAQQIARNWPPRTGVEARAARRIQPNRRREEEVVATRQPPVGLRPADDPDRFDGAWVVVMRFGGDCAGPTVEANVAIANGDISGRYAQNGESYEITGTVRDDGCLIRVAARGFEKIDFAGNLEDANGAGTLKAVITDCSGKWSAERAN